jgi:hypothetical protein
VLADYHPGVALKDLRAPSYVYARYDELGAVAIVGGQASLKYDDENSAARIPPRELNRPCKCGSKKAYKKCHGRQAKATVTDMSMWAVVVQPSDLGAEEWGYVTNDDFLMLGPVSAQLRLLVNGKLRWRRE